MSQFRASRFEFLIQHNAYKMFLGNVSKHVLRIAVIGAGMHFHFFLAPRVVVCKFASTFAAAAACIFCFYLREAGTAARFAKSFFGSVHRATVDSSTY